MRWASPSTTAVLPTPGSPMSTGLFLVRRLSTCTTRRISVSRPMTGSSLPSRATAVRSTPYFSSAWYVSSASALVTRELPRMDANAACRASGVAPAIGEHRARGRVDGGDADDQVLARHEVVAELGGEVLGALQHFVGAARTASGCRRWRRTRTGDVRARPSAAGRRPAGRRRRRRAAARWCRLAGRAGRRAGGPAPRPDCPTPRQPGRPRPAPAGCAWCRSKGPWSLLAEWNGHLVKRRQS